MRDVLPVMRKQGPFRFIWSIWQESQDDNIFVFAAALSYSWLFAIFPLIVFALSLVPFLPEAARVAARTQLNGLIQDNLPQQAADTILKNPSVAAGLDSALNSQSTLVVSLSIVVAIWAASGGVSSIMNALDKCYEIERGRKYYVAKPVSLVLTLVLVLLSLLIIALIPVGTAVRKIIEAYPDQLHLPWMTSGVVLAFDMSRYFIGLAAGMLMLGLIYHFGVSVRQRWVLFSPGAVFCFIMWVALGLAMRYYFSSTWSSGYNKTFGPAAGIAILMLVFYLYGVVLLMGAEINSEIDYDRLGVPKGTRDFRKAELELERSVKYRAEEAEEADELRKNQAAPTDIPPRSL